MNFFEKLEAAKTALEEDIDISQQGEDDFGDEETVSE